MRRALALIGVLGFASCDWMIEDPCCHSIPQIESCEANAVVTRDPDGVELFRRACAADEQCFAFTEKKATCRLQERCADPPAPHECRVDSLVYCERGEAFLSRINCPGRCEPNTSAGPRCVDLHAKACQEDACDGGDKLLCRNGFTARFAACLEADKAAGGTCRLNHDEPVCAQPDAARCDAASYKKRHCQGAEIVSCRKGFIWRHRCPEGTTCILERYGKSNPTYHPVCRR
jgi:hypothetical protein